MAKAATDRKTPARRDGRRNVTTYMFPDTIKALKMAALEDGETVYEIVEKAVGEWLARRKQG